ncbi:peptide-methionine (S)-S-oxide reductase MsrA [Neisseriaceae bacterium TC5R-5]|nr:peptide-methionine (S)-S-oxide reductase MsrA [Neisseriaceae bacterium TC5R-5]
MNKATLAGGCFWCIEAAYQQLRGVQQAVSGYLGGDSAHPSYQQVCSGSSGHVEAVEICFDPAIIDYSSLLRVFFTLHDPTTLNRQGNDIGPQYASVIFYHDDAQQQLAQVVLAELAPHYASPIVTRLQAASAFYPAEDYHQGYFTQHGHEPYCQMIVAPKLAKFRQQFADKLKA